MRAGSSATVKGSAPQAPRAAASASAALAHRPPADVVARTMVVALEPEAVIERLVGMGLDGLEPRPMAWDRPFMHVHHEGRIFYERTSDGIVLWRRPMLPWFRGFQEPIPYPDMLEVSIEAIPRGSRVQMRWRPHPLTPGATRWQATMSGMLWIFVLASLSVTGWPGEMVVILLVAFTAWAHTLTRFYRTRRALQSVLPHAHAALAAHELGAADFAGSAFRVGAAETGEGRALGKAPRET